MSFSEIVIIMAIALILFGPDDLPDIARMIGRIVYEVRKAINDLTKEFEDVVKEPVATMNKALDDITKPGRPSTVSKTTMDESSVEERSIEENTLPESREEESTDAVQKRTESEELLTYEDDPLAQLPSDVVSYEQDKEEKGSSR